MYASPPTWSGNAHSLGVLEERENMRIQRSAITRFIAGMLIGLSAMGGLFAVASAAASSLGGNFAVEQAASHKRNADFAASAVRFTAPQL
jgi:hypothetical protein